MKPFKPAITKSLASLADAENNTQRIMNHGDIKSNNNNVNSKEDSEDFRERLRQELGNRGFISSL